MTDCKMTEDRPLVVCLHGSASNGGQWRPLRRALRGRCRVFTPDLIGYGSRRFRTDGRFRLQQEVDAVIEQIGDIDEPFHLIAHSYGGVVATLLARRYPERVRSLILYEPVNFAVLFDAGLHTAEAQEIRCVRSGFGDIGASPLLRWRGARRFVRYWSHAGAWRRLTFRKRRTVARLMPKVVAEYDAILAAHAELSHLGDLRMPVRLLCGTATTAAAKRICELTARQLEDVRLVRLVGIGHMAPLSDPDRVNPMLIDYILPQSEREAGFDAGRARA